MLIDLVKKNRSYRGYNENRNVTKEELLELVDCARLCPSTANAQPLRYYLAWEEEETRRIQAHTNWAKALPKLKLPHKGMCPTAFIIILQDTAVDENLSKYQKDVGITAQTMLLAATEKGLGGCMIGSFGAGSLKTELNLPDNLAPLLVVAVGEPAETVELVEIGQGESTNYYRDEKDVHYVPKRRLEDIVVARGE